MELIKFTTSDNFPLYGGLWLPTKKTKKAVLHIHGMTDFFYEGELMQAIKNAALKNEYAFFSFNNRGGGIINLINKKFLGTSFERFEDCIKDIDAAISGMEKRGYTEFTLSGHSTGCQKSIYYQAKRKRKDIKSIILLSPADDMGYQKKILKKHFKASVEFTGKLVKNGKGNTIVPEKFSTPFFSAKRYYQIYKQDSIEGNIFNYEKDLPILKKITVPVLAIFGEKEKYCAISPKLMLEKIKHQFQHKKSAVELIHGGDHSFHGKEKTVENKILKWIKSV